METTKLEKEFKKWANQVEFSVGEMEKFAGEMADPPPAEDWYDAWLTLSTPRPGDTPVVQSRRRTCAALANCVSARSNYRRGDCRSVMVMLDLACLGALKARERSFSMYLADRGSISMTYANRAYGEYATYTNGRIDSMIATWKREGEELLESLSSAVYHLRE